jgi:hypothetical protein
MRIVSEVRRVNEGLGVAVVWPFYFLLGLKFNHLYDGAGKTGSINKTDFI